MDEARPSAQRLSALVRLCFAPKPGVRIERLSGGVSCDIYRVETASGTVRVKQALYKLHVAAYRHTPL